MMNNQQQPPNKNGKLIVLILVLLLSAWQIVLPIGIIAGVVYLFVRVAKSRPNTGPDFGGQKAIEQPAPSRKDDCPQRIFCFHKDKGEHHVARGKEIDPWDRPDIDIRKYQRKE